MCGRVGLQPLRELALRFKPEVPQWLKRLLKKDSNK
jgi:hypothetical protein